MNLSPFLVGDSVLHLNTMVDSPPIQMGIGSQIAKVFGHGYNEHRYEMERSVIFTKMPIKKKKAFPTSPLKCIFRLIKSLHKHEFELPFLEDYFLSFIILS